MKKQVLTGCSVLKKSINFQKLLRGNIALLCHSASIDSEFNHSINIINNIVGNKLIKIFGPQHGFVTDVQDNMVETNDFVHPHFKIPVHSLYGKTRSPSEDMLSNIDTFVIDLQDVGTRVYTYIHTMTLAMEKCAELNIPVVILDRPNPIGGEIIEGNILDPAYSSFVGRYPIPMRHGLTMGEMALYANKYLQNPCQLEIVPMEKWNRTDHWNNTNLPWVLPSPNLPTTESALTFVATVLFEGTNISEGRGTTKSLELIGHPSLEAFSFTEMISEKANNEGLKGFKLRPQVFLPTFQKHQGKACGGFQIHVVNELEFRPWSFGQFLCRELFHLLGDQFEWNNRPYEYEFEGLAIDYINGSAKVRKWAESNGDLKELEKIEQENLKDYMDKRKDILIY